MPQRCQGFSTALGETSVSQCPYDAEPDAPYCTFHTKVVAGLITTIDGKKDPSWRPTKNKKGERVLSPLEQLLLDHDPLEQQVEEWA